MREIYGAFFWALGIVMVIAISIEDTPPILVPYYAGLAAVAFICTTALVFRRR